MSKLYSLNKLQDVAQGDDAFVQDMVNTFIDNISEEIANIQKLTTKGEWEAIGKIAHKIAPKYAYIDAESLYVLAADIETKIQNGYGLAEIETITHQLCTDSLVLLDELRKTHSKKPTKMKVLICDDDPMTLKALEFQFKKDGYNVVKANNGKDAIQILTDDKNLNLLVTDLYMPINGGLELITYVRDVLNSKLPIIILTRANVEETIKYAFDLGANGYLTKPFKLEDIKEHVDSVIKDAQAV